ncbi:MAG: GNAT family N-acetyltransferase, partial [Anaerolineales bacterium]|nr:GNAT family N-acetyltransferase [Anaerolineales bacterium]
PPLMPWAPVADVFILDNFQGRGLGKWLVSSIMEHPDLQGLRRMLLATKDAHGLYARFGFEVTRTPERLMEILNPYGSRPSEDSSR